MEEIHLLRYYIASMAITLLTLVLFISPIKTSADADSELTNQQNTFSFYPEDTSILNEDISSWFDLDTSSLKGKTIELGIIARNNSDKNKTIYLKPTYGLTATNGGIDQNDKEKTSRTGFLNDDFAIKDNIKDLPEKVTIDKNSEKVINFKVKVPKGKGQYVSGITYVDEKYIKDEENKKEEDGSFDIKHTVSFSTAIVLNNSEEKKEEVDYTKAIFESKKDRPNLRVKMENQNKMLKEANSEYKVIRLEDKKEIFNGKISNTLMSPKTYIHYGLGWEGDLKPGKYKLVINNDIELPFEIKRNEIKTIQKGEDVNILDDMAWWMWLLIAILILLIIWLLLRNRKNKKETKELRQATEEVRKELEEMKNSNTENKNRENNNEKNDEEN